MSDSEEEDFILSKEQLLRLVDPYSSRPELCNHSPEKLMKILFKLCTENYEFRTEDYVIPEANVKKQVDKELKDLSRKHRELSARERDLEAREKELFDRRKK